MHAKRALRRCSDTAAPRPTRLSYRLVIAHSAAELMQATEGVVHTLPDGQSITIQGEGLRLGQAALQPSLLGGDLPDLPAATVTQIMQHPDGPTRKVQYTTNQNMLRMLDHQLHPGFPAGLCQ